ncbi:hypothetical protein BH24ACT22_BH24ACT22_18870 [soil metagenome]
MNNEDDSRVLFNITATLFLAGRETRTSAFWRTPGKWDESDKYAGAVRAGAGVPIRVCGASHTRNGDACTVGVV